MSGYELVGVASVLTCNSGSLSGNLDGIFEEGRCDHNPMFATAFSKVELHRHF